MFKVLVACFKESSTKCTLKPRHQQHHNNTTSTTTTTTTSSPEFYQGQHCKPPLDTEKQIGLFRQLLQWGSQRSHRLEVGFCCCCCCCCWLLVVCCYCWLQEISGCCCCCRRCLSRLTETSIYCFRKIQSSCFGSKSPIFKEIPHVRVKYDR